MKIKSFYCALLAGLSLTAATVVFADNGTIRIGTFNPATGPATAIGDPELKAVRLWVRKINEDGGLLGKKIELVEYDDQSKAAMAVSYMKRLIQNDKVDIVVAGGVSGNALAAAPIAEAAGIPFVAMGTTSKLTEPVRPWVFKVAAGEALTVKKTFVHMKNRGIKKVGMLTSTSAFGVSGRQAAQDLAAEMGLTLVADEQYADADKDVSPQLNTIRGRGADAVFVFGLGAGSALAAKNFHQLQIGVPLYVSTGNATDRFIELAGPGAEGVLMSTVPMPIVDQLKDNDPRKKIILDLKREYEKEYKIEVSAFAATGYDGLMIAVDAIKRAGGVGDKEKLRKALESTKGLVLINGTYTYSPQDHAGLDIDSVYTMRVKGKGFALEQDKP
jgi:branched-chain amino acid transport system substrate-binding protein